MGSIIPNIRANHQFLFFEITGQVGTLVNDAFFGGWIPSNLSTDFVLIQVLAANGRDLSRALTACSKKDTPFSAAVENVAPQTHGFFSQKKHEGSM